MEQYRNQPLMLAVVAGEGGRAGDSLTLRGFTATSDTCQDGAKENRQYFPRYLFYGGVEVLKGA